MFLIIEEAKKAILDVSQGAVRVLWFYFTLIYYKTTQILQ